MNLNQKIFFYLGCSFLGAAAALLVRNIPISWMFLSVVLWLLFATPPAISGEKLHQKNKVDLKRVILALCISVPSGMAILQLSRLWDSLEFALFGAFSAISIYGLIYFINSVKKLKKIY